MCFSCAGRAIRHRACALKDMAVAIINSELDPDFEKLCEEISVARKNRGMLCKFCVVLPHNSKSQRSSFQNIYQNAHFSPLQ